MVQQPKQRTPLPAARLLSQYLQVMQRVTGEDHMCVRGEMREVGGNPQYAVQAEFFQILQQNRQHLLNTSRQGGDGKFEFRGGI